MTHKFLILILIFLTAHVSVKCYFFSKEFSKEFLDSFVPFGDPIATVQFLDEVPMQNEGVKNFTQERFSRIEHGKKELYISFAKGIVGLMHQLKIWEDFLKEAFTAGNWQPMVLIFYHTNSNDSKDHDENEVQFHQQLSNNLQNKFNEVGRAFHLNSDVYIVTRNNDQNNKKFKFYEIYTIPSTGIIVQCVSKSAIDITAQSVNFYDLLRKARRRYNLHGSPFRATSARDPSSFLSPPKLGNYDILKIIEDGTPTLAFSELQFIMNFTPIYKTGDWISRYKNGTIKGTTVHQLRRGEADIFIGLSSLLPYRAVELTFLQPSYSDGVSGYFIQPATSSLRDSVIQPFSPTLWITLGATYTLIFLSTVGIVFIRICSKISISEGWTILKVLGSKDIGIVSESFIWTISSLCQQGWYIRPRSSPLRILFFVGYFTGLISYLAFSASVISILAVQLVPIKSRRDLLDSDLTFYADNKSSTMAYLVQFLEETTNVKFGGAVDIPRALDKLRKKESCTFLAFPHYFYLIAASMGVSDQWICHHLSSLPVTLSPTPHSMLVYKNSEYLEILNYKLIKRMERGLNHRFGVNFNLAATTKCLRSQHTKLFSLGNGDIFTTFVILIFGMNSGFFVLLLEIFMNSRTRRVKSVQRCLEH